MLTNFANNKTTLTNFGDNKILVKTIGNNDIILTYLDDVNIDNEIYDKIYNFFLFGLLVFYEIVSIFLYYRHPHIIDSIDFKVSLFLKLIFFI